MRLERIIFLFSVIFIGILEIFQKNSNAEEIKNLPGLTFEINFKQFSGYLDAGDGQQLFYW